VEAVTESRKPVCPSRPRFACLIDGQYAAVAQAIDPACGISACSLQLAERETPNSGKEKDERKA
jgi:hypothetical protein